MCSKGVLGKKISELSTFLILNSELHVVQENYQLSEVESFLARVEAIRSGLKDSNPGHVIAHMTGSDLLQGLNTFSSKCNHKIYFCS